ncbi:FecR family protein [Chitinophaga defluvii]|uniref:FecR domain-containing protein n=1 Tax=Chitinophaga defluvii TaxID=3163343 RepID=A0ABV2T5U5_9BACT
MQINSNTSTSPLKKSNAPLPVTCRSSYRPWGLPVLLVLASFCNFNWGCQENTTPGITSLMDSTETYILHEGTLGTRKNVTLADGTSVILNSNSTLLVPGSFPAKHRRVILDGEAFFAVPAADSPFVVKTDKLTATTAGTAFKIRSFITQQGATAYILDGKVKMVKSYHSPTDNQPEDLERGNMILANKEIDLMEKETFVPEEQEAWLKDSLVLQHVPLMATVRKLEEWYNTTITITGDASKVPDISGSFYRFTLQQTLAELGKNYHFTFKEKDGGIVIKF